MLFQLQLWATWILYAVLVDLTDGRGRTTASALPARFRWRWVYRGLSHFTYCPYQRLKATDVVTFLADNADWLGVLKRKRKPKRPAPADDALDRFIRSLTCD